MVEIKFEIGWIEQGGNSSIVDNIKWNAHHMHSRIATVQETAVSQCY